MKRLLILLALLISTPAFAQNNGIWFINANGGRTIVGTSNPLPITGTFTPSTSSPEFTPIAPATATATNGILLGLQYNSTQATFTNGQQGSVQGSSRGAIYVATGADSFVVTGSGTAGTAATGILTIQGIASMTPVQVSQATASNLNATVVGTGTFATQSAITAASGSFVSGSQSIGITPTDRTVTSATGASQTIMNANASRKALTFVNTGNANCGVNPTGGTAAIGGAGTFTLAPLGAWTPRVPTLAAVTAICTAGQPLYADEG